MLVSTSLALSLGLSLSGLTSASPLLQHRQDDSSSDDVVPISTPAPDANSTDSILKPETIALLETTALTFGLPGAIVAYTSPKGDGVWTFGNRSVEGEAVTADTHFALASNSKFFLGTILGWLAEKNTTTPNGDVYTLDMPLKDFIPDFKMYDDNATEQATTLDFMSHQTGLPPHNFAINPSDTDKTWMERLRYLKPLHSFRGGFTYSNVNFAAAGYIVEVLTGRSYYDILDEYIFDPLGMDAGSDYTQLKAEGAEISQGWIRQDINYIQCAVEAAELAAASANATDGTTPAGSDADADAEAGAEAPSREELLAAFGLPLSCLGTPEGMEFWTDGPGQEWGAGGNVIATGNALVKWMKEVLNPSHIPLSVHERVEEPPVANEEGTGYAMGTIRAPYRGYVASTHDGALPGSNSNTMRIRNESVGVFTLSTDDGYASLWYNIALPAVLDDLLDLPPVEAAADNSTGGAEGASDTASNPLEGLPVRVPPPADARPPPDTAEWVGSTFEAPGYAPFTLSSIDLSDFEATEAAEIPIDFLTIDAATLGEISLPVEGEVLYAKWDQTVAQYLFFTPFDGPIYNVTIISSWSRLGLHYSSLVNASADGNSTDAETAMATTDTAYIGKFWGAPTAVLGEDGIGFFNGFWASQGVEGNVQAVEEGIADAAEVFFSRQQ